MTTRLLTGEGRIWPEITAAAKKASRADVAVAYFGEGGAKLLPLKKGSRLVVDASEGRVKAGGTCPAELLKLHNTGVAVYSVPNLHAKVFAFPRRAFIGSTNVSSRSGAFLLEAVVEATARDLVADARLFVRGLAAGNQVSPETLEELQAVWKPPKVPGGDDRKPPGPRRRRSAVWIAGYDYGWYGTPSRADAAAEKQIMQDWGGNRTTHYLDKVAHQRKPSWQAGDTVVFIEDEHPKQFVWPPARVIAVREQQGKGPRTWVTHCEYPYGNRCAFRLMVKRLGRGWKQKLQNDGKLSREDSAALLRWWDRRGVGS